MPYTFKTNQLDRPPVEGEELVLTSNHSHVANEFSLGDAIYVFVENGSPFGKVGGLVAKGVLQRAESVGKSVQLTILFDGVRVSTALSLPSLDRFAHPQKHLLPEVQNPALGDVSSIMQNVAEVRRNTTGQPIHPLSNDAADWLNLYHFQKEKI